jgi:hypothetical protein
MLELLAFCGFLGGLVWAGAGFLSEGRPGKKAVPPVLVIAGFVGVVSIFAVFSFDLSLRSLAYWRLAIASAIVGYVGADILNSMFELMVRYRKPGAQHAKAGGKAC